MTCGKVFSRLYPVRAGVFEGGHQLDLVEGTPTSDLVDLGVAKVTALMKGLLPFLPSLLHACFFFLLFLFLCSNVEPLLWTPPVKFLVGRRRGALQC